MTNILFVDTWVKVLVIAAIVIFFFVVTIINLKIKKPKDCVDADSKCSTCLIECIHNTNKDYEQDSKQ